MHVHRHKAYLVVWALLTPSSLLVNLPGPNEESMTQSALQCVAWPTLSASNSLTCLHGKLSVLYILLYEAALLMLGCQCGNRLLHASCASGQLSAFAAVQYCARGSLHDVLMRAGRSKVTCPVLMLQSACLSTLSALQALSCRNSCRHSVGIPSCLWFLNLLSLSPGTADNYNLFVFLVWATRVS